MLTHMTVTAPQDLRNFVVQTPYSYIPQTSNHFLAPPTVTEASCKGETPEISSHTIRNIPMLLLRLNCIWFHNPARRRYLQDSGCSRGLYQLLAGVPAPLLDWTECRCRPSRSYQNASRTGVATCTIVNPFF